jgi:hypothetical protein
MLSSSTLALAETLSEKLSEPFLDKVLAGSLGVAWDSANPIRANLFAAGIRELVTYVLHDFAPDEQVKACDWYVIDQENASKNNLDTKGKITRNHRMIYATQGGLSDASLVELGVDIENDHKKLKSVIDELSKYTHVRPGTLLEGDDAVSEFMRETLSVMITFLDTITGVRQAISHVVSESVNVIADEALTESVVQELDELSTHTFVDEVIADDIRVVSIGPKEIEFNVCGTVYVQLNYGSGSDFRRGEGASLSSKFPFSVRMAASVADMEPYMLEPVSVNTDSFYE